MAVITFLGAAASCHRELLAASCRTRLRGAAGVHDIDEQRLETRPRSPGRPRAAGRQPADRGQRRRRTAAGRDFVINAIQVGGYRDRGDFEIPARYGVNQTSRHAGVGGISARCALPVLAGIASDIRECCRTRGCEQPTDGDEHRVPRAIAPD